MMRHSPAQQRLARLLRTFYVVLGVAPATSFDEMYSRYRELALQYHPDVAGGDVEKFKELTAAWSVLRHPAQRRAYDMQLRMEGVLNCTTCDGRGLVRRNKSFATVIEVICADCGGSGQR